MQPAMQPNNTPTPAAHFDRFARFYDDDYRTYDDDLGLILEMAEDADGPVVELGCGTGRVLLPLADAGLEATGVDISPALLAVARARLAATGLAARITLVEGDVRDPGLPEQAFALAICTSNTLMHLTDAVDQELTLRAAWRLLRPGGRLMLDLFNPDIARLLEVNGLVELADRWTDATTGAEVTKWSVRSVDIAEQIQETLFIYEEMLPTGETRRTNCPFVLRFLWRNEGELMLRAAGFVVEEVWGEFDGTPYDAMSDHLIFIARRP
jgi:SAM-dependent methyltransferase